MSITHAHDIQIRWEVEKPKEIRKGININQKEVKCVLFLFVEIHFYHRQNHCPSTWRINFGSEDLSRSFARRIEKKLYRMLLRKGIFPFPLSPKFNFNFSIFKFQVSFPSLLLHYFIHNLHLLPVINNKRSPFPRIYYLMS